MCQNFTGIVKTAATDNVRNIRCGTTCRCPGDITPRQTLRRSGGCLKRQLNLTARSESAVSKSLMIEILVRAGTFRMRLEQAVIRQAGIYPGRNRDVFYQKR